jgi:hypothetical protein
VGWTLRRSLTPPETRGRRPAHPLIHVPGCAQLIWKILDAGSDAEAIADFLSLRTQFGRAVPKTDTSLYVGRCRAEVRCSEITSNLLLRSLSSQDLRRLLPLLEKVVLTPRRVLQHDKTHVEYVYFIEEGFCPSNLSPLIIKSADNGLRIVTLAASMPRACLSNTSCTSHICATSAHG